MKVTSLNYGHYDTHKEANNVLKKKFPSAMIFVDENKKYTIRVQFSIKPDAFDEIVSTDPEYWISR